MIVVTVTFDDDILHLPTFVERFAVVIRDRNSLDELSQALQTDVWIVCSPATPCVHDENGVSGWDYFGIDEWMFIEDVIPFDDQEGGLC